MPDKPFQMPCGRCLKCQVVTATGWAVRGMNELSEHEKSMFLTLSYAPKHLPEGNTLVREHIQKFIRALRDHARKKDQKIRFIYCGEYGKERGRAHYHAVIFGYEFEDLEFHKYSKKNEQFPLYTSEKLLKLWPYGIHEIGSVTMQSIAYLAKYTTKKEYGPSAKVAYRDKVPPFVQGSTKPAIGIPWLQKYWKDVYPEDFCLIDGVKRKPPTSYDDWLSQNHPEMFAQVKRARIRKAYQHKKDHPEEYTPERLYAKQEHFREINRNKTRDYE